MATALRASTSFGAGTPANTTTWTVPIPASAQAGDVAVITTASNTSTNTLTLSTGWTLASGPDATTTLATCWMGYKELAAADLGGSVTLTFSASARVIGQMDVISGGTLTGAIVGKSVAAGAETSALIPTLSSVPAGAYIAAHFPRRIGSGAAPVVTIPAGWTDNGNRIESTNATGANLSTVTARKIAATAGTYGGETVTLSGVGTIYAVAIPSAAPVDPPPPTGRTGKPKVWDGTAWAARSAKVWNGTAWVTRPFKAHDGTGWVTSK